MRARLPADIFEAGLPGFAVCVTSSAVIFSPRSLVMGKIAVIRVLSVCECVVVFWWSSSHFRNSLVITSPIESSDRVNTVGTPVTQYISGMIVDQV